MVGGLTMGRAVAALAAALLAGCGTRSQGAAGGPYDRLMAEAIPRVEAQVGLHFKTPPKLERRTKEQVHDFLLRQFDQSAGAKELAGAQATYRLLGLIPDTMRLRPLYLDVLTEQIIGFYDPATRVLYVVDGSPPDVVRLTIDHELVHALQDQYINLDSIQNATGNDDRSAAAQAVIEGEAMYEQLSMMLGADNFASRLPGGWDRVREMIRENSSTMPRFSSAPMAIQEDLLFPYLSGTEFLRRYSEHYPGKVPFRDMPVSTEQVLHTDAYFDSTRDAPWTVTLPPPATRDVSVPFTNTLGEFDTRLFLYQHTQSTADAASGAAGWGGDRYEVLDTPKGPAFVWALVWDTPFDAAEFFNLLDVVVPRRYPGATAHEPSDGVKEWRTARRTVRARAVTLDGRPGVVYVDVPAGVTPDLITITRITVRR